MTNTIFLQLSISKPCLTTQSKLIHYNHALDQMWPFYRLFSETLIICISALIFILTTSWILTNLLIRLHWEKKQTYPVLMKNTVFFNITRNHLSASLCDLYNVCNYTFTWRTTPTPTTLHILRKQYDAFEAKTQCQIRSKSFIVFIMKNLCHVLICLEFSFRLSSSAYQTQKIASILTHTSLSNFSILQ